MHPQRSILPALLALALAASTLQAQTAGTASGNGTIDRFSANPDPAGEHLKELAPFAPRFSYAFREKIGGGTYTWVVLSDKEPPIATLQKASDRAQARSTWCQQEKTSWVALMLDPEGAVNVYYLCPANGNVNTEMLSSANGLDSVVVQFTTQNAKRLAGTLRTGRGSCPANADGSGQAYCEKTGAFTFDAPLVP